MTWHVTLACISDIRYASGALRYDLSKLCQKPSRVSSVADVAFCSWLRWCVPVSADRMWRFWRRVCLTWFAVSRWPGVTGSTWTSCGASTPARWSTAAFCTTWPSSAARSDRNGNTGASSQTDQHRNEANCFPSSPPLPPPSLICHPSRQTSFGDRGYLCTASLEATLHWEAPTNSNNRHCVLVSV